MATQKKTAPTKSTKNPKVRAIAGKVTAIAVRAANLKIVNREGYKQAALVLKQAKAYQKELKDLKSGVVSAINRAKEEAIAQFEAVLEKIGVVERQLKDAMLAFDKKESAAIDHEQQKLDRQTNKKRDKILARAQAARSAGKSEKAEDLEHQARDVISPTLAAATPHVKGIAIVHRWKYEITDEAALPRAYTLPDHAKLNKAVQALGDHANIPGVRIFEDTDISSKSV